MEKETNNKSENENINNRVEDDKYTDNTEIKNNKSTNKELKNSDEIDDNQFKNIKSINNPDIKENEGDKAEDDCLKKELSIKGKF